MFELKCENKVIEFVGKLNEELPKGIEGFKVRPELSVEMGCCHQSAHVGCLFTWWIDRQKWTCPHCRDVYLEGERSGLSFEETRGHRESSI